MDRRSSLLGRIIAVVAAGLLAATLGAAPATASGPPGPGPYPKLDVDGNDPPMICRDSDGTVLYNDTSWTLEPLVRGPLFAPVVLWLQGRSNVPVIPLEFSSNGYPLIWQTEDAGPAESGLIEGAPFGGRPVGYGPAPTDTARRVTCAYGQYGHFDFGTYVITAGLAQILGLPSRLVGRVLHFDNEGAVTFSVPRYLFPLTTSVATTLPTPDQQSYPRQALPTVTCADTKDGTRRYHGSAYTLAPLVRGYGWAPMALWLGGDRIVLPRWFTSSVTGTWKTVSGYPALSGTLSATQSGAPAGYGGLPGTVSDGVDCRWSGRHSATVMVSAALATQLKLPSNLVGRTVALSGAYSIHAYAPTWLFPPA